SKVSRRPDLEIHDFSRSGKLLASSRVHHVPEAHRFSTTDGHPQPIQLISATIKLSKNQNILKLT
ncbi:MAG TPA: hypothetical protein H9820_04530, partial [Candidatus Companilactobacillus pullicola]|nr:hypothetical protein [Candidatus Companilactobacillus pullicola]